MTNSNNTPLAGDKIRSWDSAKTSNPERANYSEGIVEATRDGEIQFTLTKRVIANEDCTGDEAGHTVYTYAQGKLLGDRSIVRVEVIS
jgi:hypothetical protein